ncbi:unnamed protein product [Heterobilharzia americana]|nr:unnamed protein product [Heterobilharzia americana]
MRFLSCTSFSTITFFSFKQLKPKIQLIPLLLMSVDALLLLNNTHMYCMSSNNYRGRLNQPRTLHISAWIQLVILHNSTKERVDRKRLLSMDINLCERVNDVNIKASASKYICAIVTDFQPSLQEFSTTDSCRLGNPNQTVYISSYNSRQQ